MKFQLQYGLTNGTYLVFWGCDPTEVTTTEICGARNTDRKRKVQFFLRNRLWIKGRNALLTTEGNGFPYTSFVDLFKIRLSRVCSNLGGSKMSCHNINHFRKILPIRKCNSYLKKKKTTQSVECDIKRNRRDLFLERIATLCNIIPTWTLEPNARGRRGGEVGEWTTVH